MTANDVIHGAIMRLGYVSDEGNSPILENAMRRSLSILNELYFELHNICFEGKEFTQINDPNEEIKLPDKAAIALIYGLAAFIAQSENDSDNANWYLRCYNLKRAGLSTRTKRVDTLPRV